MKDPRILPLIHVPAFLGLSLGWVLFLGTAVAIVFVAAGLPTDDPLRALGATGMGLLSMLQIAGILAVAAGLAAGVPARGTPDALRDRLRAAFPVGRTSAPMLAAGLIGGLVVWVFPSWVAEKLMQRFPDFESTLEVLTELLLTSGPLARAVLVVTIAVSAPLVEELIFRGYLWRVFELGVGRTGALVGTTVLFAAYHLDPIHVVALLPTALFLGWLRLASGSLVAPILAHFVNNALGVGLALAFPTDPSTELGVAAGVAGISATLAVVGVTWALDRRAAPPAAP